MIIRKKTIIVVAKQWEKKGTDKKKKNGALMKGCGWRVGLLFAGDREF